MRGDLFSVTLSLDALEWTRHWLGDLRCDLLSFGISSEDAGQPRLTIAAIESKSKTGEAPLHISATAPPFDHAIAQVCATLEALTSVVMPDAAPSLEDDLRFSSLFEHLASEALAKLHPIAANEKAKIGILRTLTSFSKRELRGSDIAMRGIVVATQRDAAVPTERRELLDRRWPITLVRCGLPELRRLIEAAALVGVPTEEHNDEPSAPKDVGETDVTGPSPFGSKQVAERVRHLGSADEAPDLADLTAYPHPETGLQRVAEPADTVHAVPTVGLTEDERQLVLQLEAACRLRGFPIDPIDLADVVVGSSLLVVPAGLAAGASMRPIEAALDDLARELGASHLSVENDPQKPYFVRFLVPRRERTFPTLPDVPPVFGDAVGGEYFGLSFGVEVDGRTNQSFLSEWPHLLVAGTTGSGKTTFLKNLLVQLDRLPTDALSVALVDGKGEYDYFGILGREKYAEPFPDVQLGPERAPDVLRWVVEEEIERRRGLLRNYFASYPRAPRSPKQAFLAARAGGVPFPISPLVVFIDEFAEIMLGAGGGARAFEDLVQRVVQAGRSALVHLVLATQRPDAHVLRGAIKANLPSRVALALPTHHDSMTVLGSKGAERLLGSGDMLFYRSAGDRIRLQGYAPWQAN